MNFEDNSARVSRREHSKNHAITPRAKGVNYRSHSGALPSGFAGEVSAFSSTSLEGKKS
jgi:hypothetical protein